MDMKAPIIKRNGWAEFCASLFQWRNVLHNVQNKLQDLIGLFSRTIYKLENLK